jgi:4'-phosphopantetheinyl transferase
MLSPHVLTLSLVDVPLHDEWLAREERERLLQFRIPKRGADWRMGRYAAKRLVAACFPGVSHPSDIVIRAAEDGAPEVFVDGAPPPLTLSISHRDGLAFCAVLPGGVPLGCDMEKIETRSAPFIEDYLTAREQQSVGAAAATDRALLANLIWSSKESALKALREGLRLDTRSVEVTLGSVGAGGWSPLQVHAAQAAFWGWWRRSDEHVFSVVAGQPIAVPVTAR